MHLGRKCLGTFNLIFKTLRQRDRLWIKVFGPADSGKVVLSYHRNILKWLDQMCGKNHSKTKLRLNNLRLFSLNQVNFQKISSCQNWGSFPRTLAKTTTLAPIDRYKESKKSEMSLSWARKLWFISISLWKMLNLPLLISKFRISSPQKKRGSMFMNS